MIDSEHPCPSPDGQAKPHIGLFGGSFDPPHIGHIALVKAGLDLGLDEIWVMPALPVHRELSGYADGHTRLHWLMLAFADDSRVKVLDWEIIQAKPTPSIHTLRLCQQRYPHITPWLMLGADAWHGITRWQAYPEHQSLCNALIFHRQGEQPYRQQPHAGWKKINANHWLHCTNTGHYYDAEVILPEISATFIRQQLQLGLSLTGLVPKVLQSRIENQYKKHHEQ